MKSRTVHLVGSLPAQDTSDALSWAVEMLGDTLGPCVPDGETGNRSDWVNRLVEALRYHADLELVRDGTWSGYKDTPVFRVRKGHRFRTIDLDYRAEFEKSWPVFREMEESAGRTFQVGIPGHVDLAAIAFGFNLPVAMRHMGPFREATIREMAAVQSLAGGEVVFQLEVPIELIMLTKLPGPAREAAARRMAREALRLVEAAAPGTRVGLHLCLGDLNNESMGVPINTWPLVTFANAMMAEWPTRRTLEFLHVPLAHGAEPPTMDPDYYAPLQYLAIPEGVPFIGGFIHEKSLIKDLVLIRDQIEHNLGRSIDVAASCGLGRRTRPAARLNLDIARAVALAD
jgi:hypothetical protein